jgi:hypothetical protein
MKYNNPIDCIMDENCLDPIVLVDEKGVKHEYEQEALIPFDNKMYAILADMEAIKNEDFENAGDVFEIDEIKQTIKLVKNVNIISTIFEIYDRLFEEKEDN